jgi:hypothetical protein
MKRVQRRLELREEINRLNDEKRKAGDKPEKLREICSRITRLEAEFRKL